MDGNSVARRGIERDSFSIDFQYFKKRLISYAWNYALLYNAE